MISLDSFVSPTSWDFEESAPDVSTSVFHEFSSPSSLGSGSHYSDTSPYSTPVNQANLDDVGVQDHSSTFLASNLSFDLNTTNDGFIPLDLTQGYIPWIFPGPEYDLSLMLDGKLVSFHGFVRAPGSTLMLFKGNGQRSRNQR
jgi:hypothetical protein